MRGQPKLIKGHKSDYWHIQYYDGKRCRTVSTGYKIGEKDAQANQALAAFIIEGSKPQSKQPDELMIMQALEDYYEEHGKHTASSATFGGHKRGIQAYFGTSAVSVLNQPVINAYVRSRRDNGLSAGTIRRELEMLRAALNHSLASGRLISVPRFKLPLAPRPRERYLTPEEANRLLDACKSIHVYAFVMLGLHTGQRKGAIENLTWFQVDFNSNLIDFREPGKPESNKNAGIVPMNAPLRAMMEDLYKHKQTEYVLEVYARKRRAGDTKKAFERAAILAGFKQEIGEDKYRATISPHTLRHTFITWAVQAGMPLYKIAKIVGHKSIRMIEQNYAKYAPEEGLDVVNTSGLVLESVKSAKGGKQ